MPTYNSEVYTRQTTQKMLARPNDTSLGRYMKIVSFNTSDFGTALAQNDTVRLVNLQQNEVLLPTSRVYFEALGASVTLAVGDGTTAGKYRAAASVTTAGSLNLDSGATDFTVVDQGATPDTLVATFAGGTPTANRKVVFYLDIARV